MGLNTVTQTFFVATVVTAVTAIGTFLYKKWQEVKIPTSWERVGSVKKLHLYPLKSGHRVEVERLEVDKFGVKQIKEDAPSYQLRDRELVVYGAKDNEFRTARTYPKMVFIDISVHDDNHFAIDAPTMRTLYVEIPKRGNDNVQNVKWWYGESVQVIDCGDEAATWFSRYIIERDSGLRLGYTDDAKPRDITKTHSKMLDYYKNLSNKSLGRFTDLTSVSLICQPSVNDLNKRIGSPQVMAENFRHNIIIDGPDLQPYDEDNWDWVKIGDVVMRNVKDCTRCILTTINPENGVRDPKREPLATLEKYRTHGGPEKSPRFGTQTEVIQTGRINIGDSVYIARKEN